MKWWRGSKIGTSQVIQSYQDGRSRVAQGREKDVVIFSAVRSALRRRAKIGFVADERRVNVGLTRARASLLLVGNLRVLRQDRHWAALIKHATNEGCAPVWGPQSACAGQCLLVGCLIARTQWHGPSLGCRAS